MTATYGVSAAGYVAMPVTAIVGETTQAILGAIDADIDTSPEEPLGQLIGILANREAALWELGQVLYNAFNPGAAANVALDNLCAITGTVREEPVASTVYCTAVFSQAGTYAAGSLVAFLNLPSPVPSVQFANEAAIVVPALVGGSPIGVSNPYTTPPTLWQSTHVGPDYGNALLGAGTGSLTGQVPVSGWVSIVDVDVPNVGHLEEADTPLRIRRQKELGALGSCTAQATAAKIEEALTAVPISFESASVTAIENDTDFPDADGLPPHTYLMVVYDGGNASNDQTIGQIIWSNKPAGITSTGAIPVTVFDSGGNPRIVYFSRPTALRTYMKIAVSVHANANPAAVEAMVKEAVVDASQGQAFTMFGQTVTPASGAASTLLPGQDVIAQAFKAIAQGQAGVLDVPSLALGFAPAPTGTANLHVSATQIAVLQSTSDIEVDVSVFVP